MARGAIVFAASWAALAALWLLAVGAVNRTELVAGVLAGAVAASSLLLMQRVSAFRFEFRITWLLEVRAVPWHVLRESVVVLAALVRRPRSEWSERPFPTARTVAGRAFFSWAGSLAPNRIIVDVEREGAAALVHHLDASQAKDTIP